VAANLKKPADKKDDKAVDKKEKKEGGGFSLDLKWILAGLGLVAITMGSVIIGIQLAPAKYTVIEKEKLVEKLPAKPGKTVPIVASQIVNLKGGRFLRFSVSLQFAKNEVLWPEGGGGSGGHGAKAPDPLEAHKDMMKDKIVLVASRFTAEQLLTVQGKEQLKNMIKGAINAELGHGGMGSHGGDHHSAIPAAVVVTTGGGGGGAAEEHPTPEVVNVFFTDFVIQ
jgi:flagellar basal body-associated protein FliL